MEWSRLASESGTKLDFFREVSWSPELSVRPAFRELVESPDIAILARQSVADFVEAQKLSTADAAATNRLLQVKNS